MELEMESARRRSPEESACAWLAVDDEASASASDDLLFDRRRPSRSMDSVRCVWRVSSAWMWMGNACERVSVCCAMVRNWRPRDLKEQIVCQ